MAKYIKEAKIGFENCEVIKLPIEAFENLLIQDISQEIYRCACNAVGKFTKGEIYFCLFKSADREHRVFEDCNDVTTVFKRIDNGCDITDIELIYEDGTTEDIYAKWDGESEYSNINQHSKITDRGDLKVYIGRNWDNKDYELIKAYWHENEDDEMEFEEEFFKE